MPNFAFRARDAEGKLQTGSTTAPTVGQAIDELRKRGLLILNIDPIDKNASKRRISLLPATSFDVEAGMRQLALMHRSGLPLLSALRSTAEAARRPAMARRWDEIASKIEAGSNLTSALRAYPRQFTPLITALIQAGEQSGTLDQALERAAEHLERRRGFRATFLQALFYPAIVLLLTGAVTAYMVLSVIPTLEKFLGGFHKKLPEVTMALISFSRWLREYLPVVMIVLGALVILIVVLDRLPPSRRRIDRALFRMPIIGALRRMSATAVFARTLGVLNSNGIDIINSLRLVREILPRPVTASALARAQDRIMAGHTLSEALSDAKPFAPLLSRMIAVGEKTGELDRVLTDMAVFHETELARWLKRAGTLVEPAITVIVGGVVGFVYIAFFLGMFAAAGAPK